MKDFQQIEDFVLNGNHPEPVDKDIPIKYEEIMKKAWDHDINNRPDANKMYKKLSKCLEDDDVQPEKDEPKNLAPAVSDNKDDQLDETKMYKKANSYHSKRNHKEAFSIFYELASSGHKESLYYLGYYYEHGYVVDKDKKKALEYYRESADKNCNVAVSCYAEACLKLAHEYMEKAAQLGQFKAGIKLAEYKFPLPPSSDKCDKLLRYLEDDEINLQKQKLKPEDLESYRERINGLRDKIKQKQIAMKR